MLKRIGGYVATLAAAAILGLLAFDRAAPDGSPGNSPFAPFGALAHGDFGPMTTGSDPVVGRLVEALSITLPLLLLALTLAGLIALPLGVWAARRRSPVAALAQLGAAAPALVMALLLALLAGRAGLPPGGFASWHDNLPVAFGMLALPAIAAALPMAALLTLDVRDGLREVEGAGFILAAQARGLTAEQAKRQHGRRGVAVAVLAGFGPRLALLAGGVYAAEAAFKLPGVSGLVAAGMAGHHPLLVLAGTMAFATVLATAVLLLDLLRALVDPRIATRVA
ncbi:MAG: ABC transporter permease subunit [Devosia sp.]|nr:ABC transporter permease subunit [Devosia sp.]